MNSAISQEEMQAFDTLLQDIKTHLRFLLKSKKLVKKEWDTEDFSQELALKYFKNILSIAPTLRNGDHRLYLIRRMAEQILNDKLRSMQRKKRDIRRNCKTVDLIEKNNKEALDRMVLVENLRKVKARTTDDIWQVLEMRSIGKSWQQCALAVRYISPAALRLRVKRHCDALKETVA